MTLGSAGNGAARGIPAPALALGLAGLIPFWALAIGLASHHILGLDPTSLDRALATYAAIIISFLGGIRWGLASVKTEQDALSYAASVVPSLVAWSLLILPEPWRLVSLGVVALALGPIDARLASTGGAPGWLGRLRVLLSTGAGVALLLGAVGIWAV